MDPDGSHWQILAHGLRNAVDLQYTPDLDGGALFATNMGDDHLGDKLPEDTFFELDSNARPAPAAHQLRLAHLLLRQGKPVLDNTPLPEMPTPGDLQTESERPKDAGVASHSRPARRHRLRLRQAGRHRRSKARSSPPVAARPHPRPDAKLGRCPSR